MYHNVTITPMIFNKPIAFDLHVEMVFLSMTNLSIKQNLYSLEAINTLFPAFAKSNIFFIDFSMYFEENEQ